jgi:GNAT superfamily N-acetyltransferase
MVNFVSISSIDAIVKALASNFAEQLTRMYVHMPGVAIVAEPDWRGIVTNHSEVLYNAVFEARFTRDNVQERVAGVIAYFAARGGIPLTWYLTPASRPRGLAEVLAARGFNFLGRGPGMFLDLAAFAPTPNPDSPLQIVQVSNRKQLKEWLVPVKESFELSDALGKAYFGMFMAGGFEPGVPWKLFVGTLDGAPVNASRLFCAAGIAGIYNVATLPSVRGRGFGTEITIAALEAARSLGYQVAGLESSSLGYNIYRRLGFRDCCFGELYRGP